MEKRKAQDAQHRNDFVKTIQRMSIGGHNQFPDCFSNFLDLALSYFCNNMDARQMELRKHVEENEDFKSAYIDAITAYGELAEDYHDPLGDVFMEYVSHGEKGQFFTPDSLTELMSEISLNNESIFDGMKIHDCACGSGRTLLSALRKARERGVEPKLYANDLSMTCAKMTLLNFCIQRADGAVTCSDALLNDPDSTMFFKLEKVRNLVTGAVLTTYWQYTTADVEKVAEKRKEWWLWIAERGWISHNHYNLLKEESNGRVLIGIEKNGKLNAASVEKITKAQQINPLPTEIKADESGQLSLF